MMTMPPQYRSDCAIRLDKIISKMGSVKGRTLIDIGCANGYFVAGFIDKGANAIGVERDEENMALAKAHGIEVYKDLSEVSHLKFHYGLFLDLYFHSQESDAYLGWLKENCEVSFISPSGDGERNNMRLAEILMENFKSVELVYKTPYENRMIFKCV